MSPLIQAIKNKNYNQLKLLIELGHDVNVRDEDGNGLLHKAIKRKVSNKLIQLIIENGAKLQKGILHIAFDSELSDDLIRFILLKSVANVNLKDINGITLLHKAVKRNSKDLTELLLAKGADINTKVSRVWNNQADTTPLFVAAENNYKEIAELLLVNGAHVNTKNSFGETPLFIAAYNNSKGVAELLIERGADVNAKDKNEDTPLHKVASSWHDSKELAELLIIRGADVNAKNKDGETPLYRAARKSSRDVAKLLIERGADVNAKDKNEDTPLHKVASSWHDSKELAELLIIKGADVNAKNKNGEAPLYWAARNNSKEVAELLIAKGADVNIKNYKDQTILHWAINEKHKHLAALLIKKAEINGRDNNNKTPLFRSFQYECFDLFELLLNQGAKVDFKNSYTDHPDLINEYGETLEERHINPNYKLLHKGIIEEQIVLVKQAIKGGLNINEINYQSRTPLFYAIEFYHPQIFELLILHGASPEFLPPAQQKKCAMLLNQLKAQKISAILQSLIKHQES